MLTNESLTLVYWSCVPLCNLYKCFITVLTSESLTLVYWSCVPICVKSLLQCLQVNLSPLCTDLVFDSVFRFYYRVKRWISHPCVLIWCSSLCTCFITELTSESLTLVYWSCVPLCAKVLLLLLYHINNINIIIQCYYKGLQSM